MRLHHEVTMNDEAHSVDDTQLLAAAQRGDRRAFGELFDRHIRPVFWQAYGVLGDADESEDIAQEVFVVFWRRRNDVRIVDRSVLPWLMVTSKNLARNANRKQSRLTPLTLVADERAAGTDEPETNAANRQMREQIDAAVSQLSELDRAVFEACLVDGLTYEDAAQKLGVSHAAVRNRLSRLRSRLRNDLSEVRE